MKHLKTFEQYTGRENELRLLADELADEFSDRYESGNNSGQYIDGVFDEIQDDPRIDQFAAKWDMDRPAVLDDLYQTMQDSIDDIIHDLNNEWSRQQYGKKPPHSGGGFSWR